MKHLTMLTFCYVLFFNAGIATIAKCQDAAPVKNAQGHETPSGIEQSNLTFENLQMAYIAEMDAYQRYLKYAVKADEEGFHQLTSMFRAIARGEEIHALNIAALIRQTGTLSETNTDTVIVKSTKENIEFALADQVYENDVMYPEFIKQARKDKNEAAVRVFSNAVATEPTHRAMYRQALEDIEGYRGDNVPFLVCTGCGRTARSINEAACSICSTPRDNFEKVR